LLGCVDLKGEPLDLDLTFESGQIFQWRRLDGWWQGFIGRRVVRLKTEKGVLLWRSTQGADERLLRAFLDLDSRYDEMASKMRLDGFSLSLLTRYRGLRVLRQPPWPCLMSYLVSASLSITAIDRILTRIVESRAPREVEDASELPGPEEFLELERPQKGYLGRKWDYLREAARMVATGELDFERLRVLSYDDAWKLLVTNKEGHVRGIGPKVADCVLLFSLDKPEAFPMDRWILRGLTSHYAKLVPVGIRPRLVQGKEALTVKQYEEVSKNVRARFGVMGGIVQECLFLHMRTSAKLASASQPRGV
jgi:N-glycosylase/DNA lyase